jgi:hypothetical protein
MAEGTRTAGGASEKAVKHTVLDGYYATGDHECFVFDKHADPFEHGDAGTSDNDCRVYPHALMPEGTEDRRGRWTVTVAFEPLEPSS